MQTPWRIIHFDYIEDSAKLLISRRAVVHLKPYSVRRCRAGIDHYVLWAFIRVNRQSANEKLMSNRPDSLAPYSDCEGRHH